MINIPIKYQGVYLPRIRNNEDLKTNKEYINSINEQLETIQQFYKIKPTTKILDYGCGSGRLANGLRINVPTLKYYVGIDTDNRSIKWCKKWIEKHNSNYKFIHINAHNERYNPTGEIRPELPVFIDGFNLAFVNSVFTHMIEDDVKYYLDYIYKSLCPGGIIYLTAFIENKVSPMEINPAGYLDKKTSGPLHRVRYETTHFVDMLNSSGFKINVFKYHGIRRTKQSEIIASKKFQVGNYD